MLSIHQNSYLQLQNSYINARLLNRSVNLAIYKDIIPQQDINDDLEPPISRLIPEQPNLPCQQVDITRRRQGFGRWALPILRRALHSKNNITVLRAVYSICDLLSDPEKGYEAIRLQIPLRISDLLLHEDKCIREQTAICLTKFSELFDGRMAIIKNDCILTNIGHAMNDGEDAVRIQTAALLEMLARNWIIADCLVDAGFIPKILSKLQQDIDEIIEFHLETLQSLCYNNNGKYQLLELGIYKILINLLNTNNYGIIRRTLDCFMVLTSIEEGQKLALEEDLLKTTLPFLYHHKIEICTSAASVLMFCTIQSKAKISASKIKDLPRRLIKLIRNPVNESLQLFCIKTLTNIAEHPQVRAKILNKFTKQLNDLQTNLDPHYKEILLNVINWLPYQH